MFLNSKVLSCKVPHSSYSTNVTHCIKAHAAVMIGAIENHASAVAVTVQYTATTGGSVTKTVQMEMC